MEALGRSQCTNENYLAVSRVSLTEVRDCREQALFGRSVIPLRKSQKVGHGDSINGNASQVDVIHCWLLDWYLPVDNRAAVVRVFISQLHLLKDARSEVEEVICRD